MHNPRRQVHAAVVPSCQDCRCGRSGERQAETDCHLSSRNLHTFSRLVRVPCNASTLLCKTFTSSALVFPLSSRVAANAMCMYGSLRRVRPSVCTDFLRHVNVHSTVSFTQIQESGCSNLSETYTTTARAWYPHAALPGLSWSQVPYNKIVAVASLVF